MTNLVNDTVIKAGVSGVSAAASWGLQEVSYVASIIASCIGILVGLNALYNIWKGWRAK
jgi:hypothetical protein